MKLASIALAFSTLFAAFPMMRAAADDKVIQVYLDDKGQGQKCRLWLPDGIKQVRGIIIDLGNPHGSDRADFQAFARANDFALLGTLLRWPPTLDKDLEAIVADFAKRSEHPELVNAPWVMYGFSRSTGPNHKVAITRPEKVLAVLAGGVSPAVKPEEVAACKRVPTMCVIGSADPFAAGPEGVKNLDWFFGPGHYPAYRAQHIAWGAAIQWGAGHTPGTGFVMQAAFLRDVMAQRMPKDWDPAKGPPTLADAGKEEDGYLGDPTTWDQPMPAVSRVSEFKGDAMKAQWLPGPCSARVWPAYVVKEPLVSIVDPGPSGAALSVKAVNASQHIDKVEWFDGDKALQTGDALPTKNLTGMQIIYAVVTLDGKPAITRPVMTSNGRLVPPGEDSIRPTQAPLALIELPADQKATLSALIARAKYVGPAQWTPAFRDDFSTGQGPWKAGELPGKVDIVDGALQIQSEGQFVVVLPYDIPGDIAIEYRCRQIGPTPNDMAVMFDGIDGGPRPWRDGLIFHLGAGGNTKSDFQIVGEDDADLGARFEVNKWHTVRIERTGDELMAAVDGKELPRRKLTENEAHSVKGRRVGFYTVGKGSIAQFDDVVIYGRQPADPAAVQPALPDAAALAALTDSLVKLLDYQYAEQRNLADEFLAGNSAALAPSLKALQEKGIQGAKGKARVAAILKALLPPLEKH